MGKAGRVVVDLIFWRGCERMWLLSRTLVDCKEHRRARRTGRWEVGRQVRIVAQKQPNLSSALSPLASQSGRITGAWVEAKQTGGLRFQAQGEGMSWAKFGQVRLKVAHGRTQQGTQYLNFYVKHLGRARFAIGGLLGEDDHMKASMPSAYCVRHVSLFRAEHSATSVAEANLGE